MILEHASEILSAYRARTFRTDSRLRLKNVEQAVEFVNERGFIFFWPNKTFANLPSLWGAVAGDRPVPDNHDDPGHVTWDWKDKMLGQKRWYYARILRRRNTMISLELAPYFYALSPNYGDIENDYLYEYEQGNMTMEARNVYEALLKEGQLDTISLRKAAHLTSETSSSRFNRALEDLQIEMKIMPTGISKAGAWNYAFYYDIVPRHMPELQEQARFISDEEARTKLLETYLKTVAAIPETEARKLFGWTPAEFQDTVARLTKKEKIITGIQVDGHKGDWLALSKFLSQA